MQNDIKNNDSVVGAGRDLPLLRIGQVDFINCLPINSPFEELKKDLNLEIINAIPSELNRMVLNNEIDIAPISSIAYLENKDKLDLFADLCIASNGPADSVLLFSKFPIEELDGADILLSKASATSNKLIQVIFKEFLNINASFKKECSNPSATLLIGDEALLEFSKKTRNIFIYDLGSLWKKYTGLPMVFGLWVKRKGITDDLSVIETSLKKAKEIGLTSSLDKVIKKAQEKVLISTEFYSNYFKHLSYDFNPECKKGLEIFESYHKKDTLIIH